MHNLIEQMFMASFGGEALGERHDSAVLNVEAGRLAFTTDSYVVRPLFFPGGNIGSLAVYGTVNDLSMAGARPLYISVGMILEEGLPMETLWQIVQNLQAAAKEAGVQIVTGDTKVVDRGKGDGIFINTAGIGVIEHEISIAPKNVRLGDVILVNGDIGRHGMAIMAVREGLEFETSIESDAAPLNDIVQELLKAGIEIHCMRDITRGGLASALNEIAEVSKMGINIIEKDIPVRDDVHAACEILGFDSLYVACEGRFVSFIAPQDAERALAIMQSHPLGQSAAIIGSVTHDSSSQVTMKSRIGATRIVDMITGEQLPRIC